jgi:hypothetical protein
MTANTVIKSQQVAATQAKAAAMPTVGRSAPAPAPTTFQSVSQQQLKTATTMPKPKQAIPAKQTVGDVLAYMNQYVGKGMSKDGHFIGEHGLSLNGPSKKLIDSNLNVEVKTMPPSPAVRQLIMSKTLPPGQDPQNLRNRYLAELKYIPAQQFLSAVGMPDTKLYDQGGNLVTQLYLFDPNPASHKLLFPQKRSRRHKTK